MATAKFTGSPASFNLKSTWICNGSGNITSGPTTATKTVNFVVNLPTGSTISSAYIHSEWGNPKGGYAIRACNGTLVPSDTGNVSVSVGTIQGVVSFEFKFKSNGISGQAGGQASGIASVSNVYLMLEYTAPEGAEDAITKTGSVNVSNSEQMWLKGKGAAGQAWGFTVSGLPSGAFVTSANISFTTGNTYKSPGHTRLYWGSSTSGTTLWSISGSGGGNTYTVDLTTYVTGNGNYSVYFYKTKNSGGTQSNVYFSGIKVTVNYSYTINPPTAPTSITINNASSAYVAENGTATLTWSGASNGLNNPITGYGIYCDDALYSSQGSAVSSISIPAYNAGTHSWYVKTVGQYSGSPYSASVYCYTYSSPTAPAEVSISPSEVAPGESATISWSEADGGMFNSIVAYNIYRATSADGEKTLLVNITDLDDLTYTVIAPDTNGSAYYYWISSVGERSNSDGFSDLVSLATYSYTAPGAPNSCLLDSTLSHNPVALYWSGAIDGVNNAIVSYEVQRCESSDGKTWGDWETVATQSQETLSVSPPDTYGNYYWYRVKARGEVYDSAWKNCTHTLRRDHLPFSTYTDASLVAGETHVKAIHMTELQNNISILLHFYFLDEQNMTDIVAGETGLAGWTGHVEEIRSAIDFLTTYHDDWLAISANCPRADVMQQLRNVISYVEKPKCVLGICKLGAMVTE